MNARHLRYGAVPWPKRLPPTPTADQLTVRCRVQSARSVGGTRAELLSYEDSLAWEHERAAADAAHRVSGGPPYPARGRESAPRTYSTLDQWIAYDQGREPAPKYPPF